MTVDDFKMIWPVIDSRKTRNELMQEAVGDLRAQYERLGVRPVSAPAFRFHHGSARAECRKMGITPPADLPFQDGPMLIATVATVFLPNPPAVMG